MLGHKTNKQANKHALNNVHAKFILANFKAICKEAYSQKEISWNSTDILIGKKKEWYCRP